MTTLLQKQTQEVKFTEFETTGRKFAILINGDTEQRHIDNVGAAIDAMRDRGIPDSNIIVVGFYDKRKYPNILAFDSTRDGLRLLNSELTKLNLAKDDVPFVYTTGHGNYVNNRGSLVFPKEEIDQEELLKVLDPLKNSRGIYLSDQCYSGSFPNLLMEKGFKGSAFAPTSEGKETECQFFSPLVFKLIKEGKDVNGDGKTELSEIYAFAIYNLNTQRAVKGMEQIYGVYRKEIPELTNIKQLSEGEVILEIRASWCHICKDQERDFNITNMFLGNKAKIYKMDWEQNSLRAQVQKLIGKEIDRYPTFVFIKNGSVISIVQERKGVSELIDLSIKHLKLTQLDGNELSKSFIPNLASSQQNLKIDAIIALLKLNITDPEIKKKIFDAIKEIKKDESAFNSLLTRLLPINKTAFEGNPNLLQNLPYDKKIYSSIIADILLAANSFGINISNELKEFGKIAFESTPSLNIIRLYANTLLSPKNQVAALDIVLKYDSQNHVMEQLTERGYKEFKNEDSSNIFGAFFKFAESSIGEKKLYLIRAITLISSDLSSNGIVSDRLAKYCTNLLVNSVFDVSVDLQLLADMAWSLRYVTSSQTTSDILFSLRSRFEKEPKTDFILIRTLKIVGILLEKSQSRSFLEIISENLDNKNKLVSYEAVNALYLYFNRIDEMNDQIMWGILFLPRLSNILNETYDEKTSDQICKILRFFVEFGVDISGAENGLKNLLNTRTSQLATDLLKQISKLKSVPKIIR